MHAVFQAMIGCMHHVVRCRYMSRMEQRLFLKLVAEMFPRSRLPEVVRKLGGMERILEKFFESYEVWVQTWD